MTPPTNGGFEIAPNKTGVSPGTRRPTLVAVLSAPLYPPVRGDSRRGLQLVTALRSVGWRVVAVYRREETHADCDVEAMRPWCDGVVSFDGRGHRPPPGSRRDDLDAWCPPALAELVAQVANAEKADCVLVQETYLSKCLEPFDATPIVTVIDALNVFAGRKEAYARAGLRYEWITASVASETKALQRANIILAHQETEQAVIESCAPQATTVLYPCTFPIVDGSETGGRRLLLVGNAYDALEAGLHSFLETSWPKLVATNPDLQFQIVGRLGDRRLPPGVSAVGPVADPSPFYLHAGIVLNPILCGSGLKIKTIEALCHCKCLVSTPAGVQGLESYPHVYHVAPTDADFVSVINGLLADWRQVVETGKRAKEFATSYFDATHRFEKFHRALIGALAKHKPPNGWAIDAG